MSDDRPVSFDFYETWRGEERAFIMLDLAARAYAPVATHPLRLQFRAELQIRRDDGLRHGDEAPALFELEDRLVETMQTKLYAIYVGRVVSQGFTEFFFYLPSNQRDHLKAAGALVGPTAPYDLEWLFEEDAQWSGYDDLYPNGLGLQTILNRRLVAKMVESGDQLEIPREVDHGAYFSSRAQAVAAASALAAEGYRVDPLPEPKPGAPWFLQFHRDERCDGDEPNRFVSQVMELIEPWEGDYDGWGSLVQRASD